MDQRYLSIREAARYLGMSEPWLYQQASRGMLPACKFGRVWRFDRDRLDQWACSTTTSKPLFAIIPKSSGSAD
jgi:excisionase family DNA binding protein